MQKEFYITEHQNISLTQQIIVMQKKISQMEDLMNVFMVNRLAKINSLQIPVLVLCII